MSVVFKSCLLAASAVWGMGACAGLLEITGTMNEDAWRGLVRMPDGEISHYGWDFVGKERRRVYVWSRTSPT